jgi:hypothetical protein
MRRKTIQSRLWFNVYRHWYRAAIAGMTTFIAIESELRVRLSFPAHTSLTSRGRAKKLQFGNFKLSKIVVKPPTQWDNRPDDK